MAKTYRCKQSFVIGVGGANRAIRSGDVIAANDPRFKKYQHLLGDPKFFESTDDYLERTVSAVEQASAEPGEKRTVTKPRKAAVRKATAKKPEDEKGQDQ